MRRFAAKLTLQCHCSFRLRLILAWFCLLRNCRKNSSYSRRPSTPQVRPFAPRTFCGSLGAADSVVVSTLPVLFVRSRTPWYVPVTPDPTEPKGFACEKACVWPAVPLAILAVPLTLTLSPRRFLARRTSMTARPNHRSLPPGPSPEAQSASYAHVHSHSPGSAGFVSRAARSFFPQRPVSSRTFP